jgi:pimeloyl-ACP methyl ester carboxylesterase
MNTQQQAELAHINGTHLEIRERGSGEPVVFVHGAMGDECAAAVQEPSLINHYRVIDYHRRGYGRSEIPIMSVSVAEQVDDLSTILRYLGIKKAHLVGQSYGGVILLQMALDHPEVVQSLALLEAALPADFSKSPEFLSVVEKAGTHYQAGDKESAMQTFGEGVAGTDYRSRFDQTLPPGYFERWVAAADTVFQSDLPGIGVWQFGQAEAARITQPVLNMRGDKTPANFRASFENLAAWLPQAENFIVPDSSHAMLQLQPKVVTERLHSFLMRHPL